MSDSKSNVQHIDEKKIVEEREIDFFDLWWRLLEQWRGMLAVGLIFAILLPALKYHSDLNAYNNRLALEQAAQEASAAGVEEAEDATGKELSQMIAAENADMIAATLTEFPAIKALTYYKAWKTVKNYYKNSYLMKIDASRESRIMLMYYVKSGSPETDCHMAANIYARLQYQDSFTEEIAKMFGDDIPAQSMKELLWTSILESVGGADNDKGVGFSLTIVLPHHVDPDDLAQKITEALQRRHDTTEKQMGKHELVYLNSTLTTITDTEHLRQQTDTYNQMISLDNNFQKAYAALEEDQRLLVDEIMISGQVESVLKKASFGEELESMGFRRDGDINPHLSRKFVVVGFVLGVMLYAGIYLLWLLLIRRIRDERDLERRTGLRSFGGIYEYPYKKGLQSFLHSRKIYRRRHRDAGRPFADAAKIAHMIKAKAEHLGSGAVSMITLGETSDWADGIMNRQSEMLKKNGLEARVIPAVNGAYSIDDEIFKSMAPVCIVLLSGETTPHMAAEMLARLREYDISVLGTEFLEGR